MSPSVAIQGRSHRTYQCFHFETRSDGGHLQMPWIIRKDKNVHKHSQSYVARLPAKLRLHRGIRFPVDPHATKDLYWITATPKASTYPCLWIWTQDVAVRVQTRVRRDGNEHTIQKWPFCTQVGRRIYYCVIFEPTGGPLFVNNFTEHALGGENAPLKVSCSNALGSWGVLFEDPFFSESVSGIARTMEMVSSVGKINFELWDHYTCTLRGPSS